MAGPGRWRLVGALLAAVWMLVALAGCASGGSPAGASTGATASPASGCPAPSVPDPAALACQVRAGDVVVHDPLAGPASLSDAGRRTQDAYRVLGEHPEWDDVVLAALAPPLRDQARRALDADRALASLDGRPSTTLPAWRIVEPLSADQLRGYYAEAQRRFGVPWTVLAAVHLVETHMGRVVGVSSAGALGPMQFMPATWARYGLGGNVWDTRDAILGAANYLAANGAATSAGLDTALRRYNNDTRYVRAVRDYAAMMDADPREFLGLHAWPVKYRTLAGDIPLDPGYAADQPVPLSEWLATHPA